MLLQLPTCLSLKKMSSGEETEIGQGPLKEDTRLAEFFKMPSILVSSVFWRTHRHVESRTVVSLGLRSANDYINSYDFETLTQRWSSIVWCIVFIFSISTAGFAVD